MNKRQGVQGKHSFQLHKRENEHPEISHQLMGRAIKQSIHQLPKKFFHISKCLPSNAKNTLELEITKKE